MAVRIALIVLALAGAAWLTVAAGSFSAQDRIAKLALATSATPTRADLAKAEALVAARAAVQSGRADRAGHRRARVPHRRRGPRPWPRSARLTASEPRNAELWALLARVAKGYDEPLSVAAGARARALSPPVRP